MKPTANFPFRGQLSREEKEEGHNTRGLGVTVQCSGGDWVRSALVVTLTNRPADS